MNHNFSFSRRELTILDSVRENQIHRTYKNYSLIHKAYNNEQNAKKIKAAVKIQRRWRLFLRLRRNAMNSLIGMLEVEVKIQYKELDAQLVYRKTIERQIAEHHRQAASEAEEVLGDTRQAIMDFVGLQFKNSWKNSHHLSNLRLAGKYQERYLASSLNYYLEAKNRKSYLEEECVTLDQQLKSLSDRIDLLNNKLIGDNAYRLKLEAYYEHILRS